MKVQVVGAGAWGSALAALLKRSGHEVILCGKSSPHRWEPGIDFALLSVPSRFLGQMLSDWPAPPCPVISSVKGIEPVGFRRVSEMVSDAWGSQERVPFCVLSGPSFAEEVNAGQPTLVVVAGKDEALLLRVQELVHRPEFRVYRSTDLAGVELGGALKNVYAIGAGICSGLGLGANPLAAMISRALAEMIRVGVDLGGRADTFMGLSGVGDLMLTCYGPASRNRRFGEYIAQGVPPTEIEAKLGSIVEGFSTSRSVYELSKARGIPAPLATEIFHILHEGKPAGVALKDLLSRSASEEMYSLKD